MYNKFSSRRSKKCDEILCLATKDAASGRALISRPTPRVDLQLFLRHLLTLPANFSREKPRCIMTFHLAGAKFRRKIVFCHQRFGFGEGGAFISRPAPRVVLQFFLRHVLTLPANFSCEKSGCTTTFHLAGAKNSTKNCVLQPKIPLRGGQGAYISAPAKGGPSIISEALADTSC